MQSQVPYQGCRIFLAQQDVLARWLAAERFSFLALSSCKSIRGYNHKLMPEKFQGQ
jgi:hypothetical protein